MSLELPLRQRTLPAVLAQNAERDPDGTFLLDERGTLSWGRVLELSRTVARALHGFGVMPGDTVAVMLGNNRDFLLTWFGLATLGAVEVPVNPQLMATQLVERLNASAAATAVVAAEHVGLIDQVADRLETLRALIVVGPATPSARFRSAGFAELVHLADESLALAEVSVGDPVAIMYTSGSTGAPKGAVLPHGQHYVNGLQACRAAGLTSADRMFLCLPLHHNMAQGYGIWPALVSGASVWLEPRFSLTGFWDQVLRSGATVFPFVGAMLALIAQQGREVPGNPLRVAYGVPIPVHLHRDFERRYQLRLLHCYGSTEATIVAWDTDSPLGSVGRVLDGYEVRIVDDEDLPLAVGQTGEICVRAREPYSCFSGYFRDPERTMAVYRNLWFHTGDLGWLDETRTLWFVGRKGDSIRYRGEFINPHEVEQTMAGHPSVELVAVYGVPSELGEQDVMASVVLRPGNSPAPVELRDWVAERLARFAVPRYIAIVGELPMTATGKVEKQALRERGAAGAFDGRPIVKETR